MSNSPRRLPQFHSAERIADWMESRGSPAPPDSSRIKRGRLENARPGMCSLHGGRPSRLARDGRRSVGEIPEAVFYTRSSCDILTVDPVHGSDPPAAMAGGIDAANRQRPGQEVNTVGANPRRSNPDESRWTQALTSSSWGLAHGVRHPRSTCRRQGPGFTKHEQCALDFGPRGSLTQPWIASRS